MTEFTPKLLSFDKPKKLMKTYNQRYYGTYVQNMSNEDKQKWKAKHIKGDNERIEIRKTMGGTQLLIVVLKIGRSNADIQISANGKVKIWRRDWREYMLAIEEAHKVLGIAPL